MNMELHERAGQLIAQERVEAISAADQQWLRQHLAECPSCANRSALTTQTIRSLRGISVAIPPALASRTQFRVRLRAQQLRAEPRWLMVWIASGLSWVFGAATAPYIWRALEWGGHHFGVPKIVWELGFGLWWALPAAAIAVVLLLESAGRGSESVWKRQEN